MTIPGREPLVGKMKGGVAVPVNLKMVERTPHPGPLPIGSADSADAEREKRSQRLGDGCIGGSGVQCANLFARFAWEEA